MGHLPIDQQVTWVYTHDLPSTARFYGETIGLEQVLDQGGCRIFKASATSFIGVCQVRPGRFVEPKGVVITFVTDAVDEWHAALKAKGVTILEPPAYHPNFVVYCFFAADPNGYKLEFQQFRSPDWKKP
ncbi:MAG: VOC family protein [Alphaproteobacteria bacterium]|nr:VOC family protein [Alphaproteobacteria bacterium]